MENKELILKAIKARELAYCPYSNFKVGQQHFLKMERYIQAAT